VFIPKSTTSDGAASPDNSQLLEMEPASTFGQMSLENQGADSNYLTYQPTTNPYEYHDPNVHYDPTSNLSGVYYPAVTQTYIRQPVSLV